MLISLFLMIEILNLWHKDTKLTVTEAGKREMDKRDVLLTLLYC